MSLVNDNGETAVFMLRAYLWERIRKLFDSRDDNPLSGCDSVGQIAGIFSPRHRIPHLRELPDSVTNLLIQNAAVCDHNHGINGRASVLRQSDELMGKPRYGIGFAASGAVLYEIALADAVFPHVRQKPLHYVKLMIARENLLHGFLFRVRVGFLNNLRVVFDNAGELFFRQNVFP